MQILTEGSEYALYVTKPGYLFESLRFDYQESHQREPLNIDILLKPLKKGTASTMNNIFFDVDKYDLKEKSRTELNKTVMLMESNPDLKMEISGHTDNSGSDEHNRELSLNRARAVYQYLVDQGIDPDRLKFTGYGSSVPVAPNDSEENRQLNRRIEFRVL
jgi:outer membrane protein OmpA-like peptidoglycan-associated protein